MGEIISGDENAPEEVPATEASEQISEEGEEPIQEDETDTSGAMNPESSQEEDVIANTADASQTIDEAVTAVEKAVTDENIEVTNADNASDDTKAAVVAKILAAANKADLAEKFSVAVKQTEAGTDDKLEVVEATTEAAGTAKITLVITDSTDGAETPTKEVEITLDIAQLISTDDQTIDEAAAAVEKAVADENIEVTNDDNESDDTKAAVVAKILAAANKADLAEKFSVAVKQTDGSNDDKLVIEEATTEAAGTAKITLVITDSTEGAETPTKDVEITLTIAQLTTVDDQTIDDAVTAVEKAVADENIEVTNADNESDDTRATVVEKILTAANKANLDEKFSVAVKQTDGSNDDKLVIEEATTEATGTAKITLVITDSTDGAETPTKEVEITLTIEQLNE